MNSDGVEEYFAGDRFKICKQLGVGTYGEVYYAIDQLKQTKVAIKKIKFYGRESEGIPPTSLREIAILKQLNHKNIVKLEDVVMEQREDSLRLYLVFPVMDIDLKEAIKVSQGRMQPAFIRHVLRQILEGVEYLHSNKVLHRDLKPENVLLSKEEYRVKICDFGLARTIHQPLRPYTEEVMSLCYRAPEICVSNKHYSVGIDTWAIGCIFVQMVTGARLFEADSLTQLLFEILKLVAFDPKTDSDMEEEVVAVVSKVKVEKQRDFETIMQGFDPRGIHLAKKLLTLNPLRRFTCKQALDHAYFKDC